MLIPTIPSELVAQAAMLNRYAGSLQAWTFLANQGIKEEHIFAFLVAIEGPECRSHSSAHPYFA